MYKNIKSVFAALICLVFTLLSACGGTDKVNPVLSFKLEKTAKHAAVELPQSGRFNKLLDGNGKIDLGFLDKTVVSVIEDNYDGRVYIKYNNRPYFFNPVYISYDQILNNRHIAEKNKTSVLEECFAKAKESGFDSVALYVNWWDFYNGTTYNYDYYKIYYTLADKYDLKVAIIWNGYAKLGFMPWQNDREKYPSLSTVTTAEVPDLSQEIYINEACEALTQFCAWVNYIDYNCRTVLIQLEDEVNTDYGKGTWLSQYASFSALIEKMAYAVKESPYSVVTTVGITFNDYYRLVEGVSGRERIDSLLAKDVIDGLGASYLNVKDYDINLFNNSEKFCYVSKLSPATFDFFSKALSLIKQGFMFGVYELKSFDIAVNCGIYRTNSANWQARNREKVNRGILAYKGMAEASTADVLDFIKSINKLGPLLTEVSLLDITVFNMDAENNYSYISKVGDITAVFDNTLNSPFTYNSSAVCIVDPYSNYYVFTFHSAPFFTVNFIDELILTEGSFVDGVWVNESDQIKISDNRTRIVSGMVYKFRID